MSTAKVERRHREAALIAHGWPEPTKWLPYITTWLDGGPMLSPSDGMPIPTRDELRTAELFAAAEQRTREECAAMVEALAATEYDELVAKMLRALAERMRGGGGV